MSDHDALKSAFRSAEKPPRVLAGAGRADRTRAVALSPMRNLFRVLMIPIVTLSVTVGIYVQISPYERQETLMHLAAMAGCDTALKFGLSDMHEGELGFHARNDTDGNGIACESGDRVAALETGAAPTGDVVEIRQSSGAKFVKPPQIEN